MAGGAILRLGPVPSPDARAAAERAEEAVSSQLANVRKAAESWRTGLLALLGLITTVAVVKGRDSFADLDPLGQVLIGAALALALALAAIGSLKAMTAAYGDPRPRQTQGILTWDYQDSKDAVNDLKWARRLLVAALVFVAIAVGLTWYWPGTKTTNIRADFGAQSVCGTLVRANGQQIVIKEDGSEKPFQTAALSSLAIVDKCP
jgi:hypothetical protein